MLKFTDFIDSKFNESKKNDLDFINHIDDYIKRPSTAKKDADTILTGLANAKKYLKDHTYTANQEKEGIQIIEKTEQAVIDILKVKAGLRENTTRFMNARTKVVRDCLKWFSWYFRLQDHTIESQEKIMEKVVGMRYFEGFERELRMLPDWPVNQNVLSITSDPKVSNDPNAKTIQDNAQKNTQKYIKKYVKNKVSSPKLKGFQKEVDDMYGAFEGAAIASNGQESFYTLNGLKKAADAFTRVLNYLAGNIELSGNQYNNCVRAIYKFCNRCFDGTDKDLKVFKISWQRARDIINMLDYLWEEQYRYWLTDGVADFYKIKVLQY